MPIRKISRRRKTSDRSSREKGIRLPVDFFVIEQNVDSFYSYLDRNKLSELKSQMEFILHIQSLYRIYLDCEIGNEHEIEHEIECTYQEYFKHSDKLHMGWWKRVFLEIQMRSRPHDMHIFDSAVAKCIQTVKPELQMFNINVEIQVIQ